MPKRKTQQEFIADAIAVHGDKYGYDRVKYVNNLTEVEIYCPVCKRYYPQKPKLHLNGHGCIYCAGNLPLTTKDFISRATDVWGDRYTYEHSVYTTIKAKVIVTCRIHGDFPTTAYDFLQGHGCPDCGVDAIKKARRKPQEQFIAECRAVHGDRYDYSQTVYQGKRKKVTIICRKHGPFEQWPGNHLNGEGCPDCKFEKESAMQSKGREDFIKDAIAIHGNRYDYSKVRYVNNKTNVIVICPDHGPFEVMPQDHIQKRNGCPICQASKGETAIRVWLENHGIKFQCHKSVHSPLAVGKRKKFMPDFILTDYNMFIEFNGEQHYKGKELWGGEKQLKHQQARDAALREYCKQQGIRLLEIHYKDFDRIEEILDKELRTE